MSLKVHILLLLAALFYGAVSLASDKFLRVRGELLDEKTSQPISGFTIRQVEDDMDSTSFEFDGSDFEIWVQEHKQTKLYFIKEGYVVKYIFIDATFVRSWAHDKKQRIEDLKINLSAGTGRLKDPTFIAEYDPKDNHFVVIDRATRIINEEKESYKPPFPSPADTYNNVKPTNNRLALTKTFDETKAKGTKGFAKVLQGVLFADLNYCLFNEKVSEANYYLAHLKKANPKVWGDLKEIDSPDYGKIISRTINREQSMDTLFALGAYLETSRLIFQDFTSDSKVLVHLKLLKSVLDNFTPEPSSNDLVEFMIGMYSLTPPIDELVADYKSHLKNKENFEIQSDAPFLKLKENIDKIYLQMLN